MFLCLKNNRKVSLTLSVFLSYRYLLGAKSKVLLKIACVYLMANGVLNGCLARGVDSVQAVGYLALTLLLGSLDIIIRGKAIPTLDLSGLVPFFVWLWGPVPMAVGAYGILIGYDTLTSPTNM
jgi:hypothetical protein